MRRYSGGISLYILQTFVDTWRGLALCSSPSLQPDGSFHWVDFQKMSKDNSLKGMLALSKRESVFRLFDSEKSSVDI